MKNLFLLLSICPMLNCFAQTGIMINPYIDYTVQPSPNNKSPEYRDYYPNHQQIYTTARPNNVTQGFSGEYEIFIEDLYWRSDFSGHGISYDIETIGFPFMLNCFDDLNDPTPCSDCNNLTRNLVMPDANHAYNPQTNLWGTYLYRKTDMGKFGIGTSSGIGFIPKSFPYVPETHQTLVSRFFNANGSIDPIQVEREFLPHTVHKINLYLHCGSDPMANDVISTLSFLYDNTRGRMRFYPFYNNNCPGATATFHDVVFRPYLAVNVDYVNTNGEMYYDDNESNDLWTDGLGTINYFKVNEINTGGCGNAPSSGTWFLNGSLFNHPFPSPASLYLCYLFNHDGRTLAGYGSPANPTNVLNYVNTNQNFTVTKHNYIIDQNIDLNIINPTDLTIYNPSEVNITASDLHFPTGYTFKTIRGVYPTVADVTADDIPENGGPYSDLRDVPVKTDLTSESTTDAANFPLSAQPGTKHLYASRYYMNHPSQVSTLGTPKLTIEPCVRLFDCTFDVYEGATLIFEEYPGILGKEDHSSNHANTRYKIQTLGGAVLRNYTDIQYLQFGTITQTFPLHYKATDAIIAGKAVTHMGTTPFDTDQQQGDYSVENGADVTLQATNYIRLTDGFSVKSGGRFHAFCHSPGTPTACNIINSPRYGIGGSSTNAAIQNSLHNITATPNPSTGKVTLAQFNRPVQATQLTITDAYGRTVYTKANYNSASDALDFSTQPSGLYMARCTVNGNTEMVKFVVAK